MAGDQKTERPAFRRRDAGGFSGGLGDPSPGRLRKDRIRPVAGCTRGLGKGVTGVTGSLVSDNRMLVFVFFFFWGGGAPFVLVLKGNQQGKSTRKPLPCLW